MGDYAGYRLGSYTVLRPYFGGQWLLKCDCGQERIVSDQAFRLAVIPTCSCWGNSRRKTRNKKNHCVRGHEFTEENTLLTLQHGYEIRICRTCNRQRGAKAYRKKRESTPRARLPKRLPPPPDAKGAKTRGRGKITVWVFNCAKGCGREVSCLPREYSARLASGGILCRWCAAGKPSRKPPHKKKRKLYFPGRSYYRPLDDAKISAGTTFMGILAVRLAAPSLPPDDEWQTITARRDLEETYGLRRSCRIYT